MEAVHFKLLLSIFLTVFLLVPSIQAKDVRYCDKRGNYPVKITGVKISPDPVLSGSPATFSLSASADQVIDGGELVIQVSFFGVRIHSEKHNLCEKTSCPISGNFVISHSQVLPGFTPAGKYSLKMTLVGKDRTMLSCIGFDFNIRSAPLVSDS